MKCSSSDSPSWDGDNTCGFSGLPGCSRYSNGSFNDVGNIGYWWSAFSSGASNAFYRDLSFNDDTFGSSSIN